MNANDTCTGCCIGVYSYISCYEAGGYGFLVCLSCSLKSEGAGAMKLITITKMYLNILCIFISNKRQFSASWYIEQSVSGISSACLPPYLDRSPYCIVTTKQSFQQPSREANATLLAWQQILLAAKLYCIYHLKVICFIYFLTLFLFVLVWSHVMW